MTTSAPYTFIVGREPGEVVTDDPHPGRERHRPKLVHSRGRWRSRKRVIRQLAADLGYPGCLKVASDDQIIAGVLAAGVRLRDWRRFEGWGRQHPKVRRAEAVRVGQRRRTMFALLAEEGVPF